MSFSYGMLWQRCGWLRTQARRDNWDFLLHETCPLHERFLYSGSYRIIQVSALMVNPWIVIATTKEHRTVELRPEIANALIIHCCPDKGLQTLNRLLKILLIWIIFEQSVSAGIRQPRSMQKKNPKSPKRTPNQNLLCPPMCPLMAQYGASNQGVKLLLKTCPQTPQLPLCLILNSLQVCLPCSQFLKRINL